jgi:hypothetical protein
MAVMNSYRMNFQKETFLNEIISRLGTCLAAPEEEIISEMDDASCMYIISKGDCFVNKRDETGNEQ